MNWRSLMRGGETQKNLPKIPKINPTRPLKVGFEDIGDVLDEVKATTPGQGEDVTKFLGHGSFQVGGRL